jgi:uncharacterized protein (DUF488 family)
MNRLYWIEISVVLGSNVVFYRRKILVALIEVFGGSLSKTDCQKLLFLFCRRRGKNYYDFFPHKYGNFSLILTQDKNRLADLGLLTSHSDFQLRGDQTYLDQLEEKDRAILHALASEIGDIRGEELIHKAYLEAPHYVSRSQIATQILRKAEYKQVSVSWNNDQAPCLFTVGYEGLSIDAYLNLLISNNVTALVDVRKNPLSMKYGFSKTKLSDFTKLAGIKYIHIPDLGIPSNLRRDLNSAADYRKLFDFYSSQILPDRTQALEELKKIVSDQSRVAITCFEADYHFCHRHKVAEYLENDPSFHNSIIHLQKGCLCSAKDKIQNHQDGLWGENTLYISV